MEPQVSDDIYKRLNENEKQIGQLVSSVSALAESVSQLHQDFQKGFDGVYRRMENIVDKQHAIGRPNWMFIITGVATTFTVLLAIIVLHTSPIQKQAEENRDFVMKRLYQLPIDYKEFGENIATAQFVKDEVQKLKEYSRSCVANDAAMQQQIRDIEIWLQAVDQGGSRKWIGSNNTK